MGRWEPNARGRLEQAALDLYGEHGFEQTTVAEIAERAGLTERTFFRYFVDKREVLFSGASSLEQFLVGIVAGAPEQDRPIEAVATAIASVADFFQERREFTLRRQSVIGTNTELQERELIKLATLTAAIAEALRRRGVREPSASLAAEAGIAVFKISFERWISGNDESNFSQIVHEHFDELRVVTTGC
ncbi:MAG: TetR family transcriptional regulator [Acidimicrobiaceae bacterium]|nr:TetR family transcriptional regulator [Acidimicrobiaceae bacterium]